jgi:hypothetical protein
MRAGPGLRDERSEANKGTMIAPVPGGPGRFSHEHSAFSEARQSGRSGAPPEKSSRVGRVEGAVHASFSDDPFLFAALAGDAAQSAHLDRMTLIRQVLRAFLGQHLRGEPAAALLEALAQPGVAAESWPTPP